MSGDTGLPHTHQILLDEGPFLCWQDSLPGAGCGEDPAYTASSDTPVWDSACSLPPGPSSVISESKWAHLKTWPPPNFCSLCPCLASLPQLTIFLRLGRGGLLSPQTPQAFGNFLKPLPTLPALLS